MSGLKRLVIITALASVLACAFAVLGQGRDDDAAARTRLVSAAPRTSVMSAAPRTSVMSAAPRVGLVRADVSVQVHPAAVEQAIEPGFVGLSFEYPAVAGYAGTNPKAPNPVLEAMIRNLAPGQSPVLRIGGDSTDKTWWPIAGMSRPLGVRYVLTRRRLAVVRTLARQVGARLILGVNLEANDPALAAEEGHAIVSQVGLANLEAIEIGNEPNWYSKFAWYRTRAGLRVYGRPKDYSLTEFIHQFSVTRSLLGSTAVAGPALGGYDWLTGLSTFVAAEPRLSLVTVHRYALDGCSRDPLSSSYPTIANLLTPAASRGLAASVRTYAAVAHSHGSALRVDELNSVACGGRSGVSDTFASALWVLDTLFAMAHAGADGINIHTFPGAPYELFSFHRGRSGWTGTVRPEYYGLLAFLQAAPAGSRLLGLSRRGSSSVRTWATLAPDGQIRVTLINTNLRHAQVVSVRGAAQSRSASVERLLAPGVAATTGITLGGQSIASRSRTGRLTGTRRERALTRVGGQYEVTLPPASAAIVTLG